MVELDSARDVDIYGPFQTVAAASTCCVSSSSMVALCDVEGHVHLFQPQGFEDHAMAGNCDVLHRIDEFSCILSALEAVDGHGHADIGTSAPGLSPPASAPPGRVCRLVGIVTTCRSG